MSKVAELRARDSELDREWRWLISALNAVARSRAEEGDLQAFRLMQAQCMAVGERRVEIGMAELEKPFMARR